jgi:hypothetical protein
MPTFSAASLRNVAIFVRRSLRNHSEEQACPAYRKNLAPSAQVGLLLYSAASISCGMPIPIGIEAWRFDFEFDRIFWFVSLGNEFVEMQRTESAKSVAV